MFFVQNARNNIKGKCSSCILFILFTFFEKQKITSFVNFHVPNEIETTINHTASVFCRSDNIKALLCYLCIFSLIVLFILNNCKLKSNTFNSIKQINELLKRILLVRFINHNFNCNGGYIVYTKQNQTSMQTIAMLFI